MYIFIIKKPHVSYVHLRFMQAAISVPVTLFRNSLPVADLLPTCFTWRNFLHFHVGRPAIILLQGRTWSAFLNGFAICSDNDQLLLLWLFHDNNFKTVLQPKITLSATPRGSKTFIGSEITKIHNYLELLKLLGNSSCDYATDSER